MIPVAEKEKQILSKVQDPEQKERVFSALVAEYQERLYWHIRKIVVVHDDADDVLQNTFLKAWRSLKSYRGESGFYTWLYRIATNEALSFLKQKNRNYSDSIDEWGESMGERLEADSWFDGDEAQLRLQKALLRLPEKQRLVFNMKYFDEMKYDEISKILQTSVGALKASYHHAVKKLHVYLEND